MVERTGVVRLVVHHGCNCCWWSFFAMDPRKPGALVFFDARWFGWRAFEAPFVAFVGRCGVVALVLMSQHVFDGGKFASFGLNSFIDQFPSKTRNGAPSQSNDTLCIF